MPEIHNYYSCVHLPLFDCVSDLFYRRSMFTTWSFMTWLYSELQIREYIRRIIFNSSLRIIHLSTSWCRSLVTIPGTALVNIRKLKWDPTGHKLAFVKNFDVYVTVEFGAVLRLDILIETTLLFTSKGRGFPSKTGNKWRRQKITI